MMGVAFIALSADASKRRQVEQITLQLANSLTVKPPVQSVTPTGNVGALWKNYFKRRYIARYYSNSGYRSNQHLWLCSDGRFFRKSVLQFGAGSVSEISTPGTDYSASGAGGERWTYRVLLDQKLYLDGKKWLRGKNEVCH